MTSARASSEVGQKHVPVLCAEVVASLMPSPPTNTAWIGIDCTFGRGGHAGALLARGGNDARLLALDRDPQAVAAAHRSGDRRLHAVCAPFSCLAQIAEGEGMSGKADAVLFDLGVSSPQLDQPERGFSFMADGPLDMRMDPDNGPSAAQWLADVSERTLADTLRRLGEERWAKRIARAVVRRRAERPIERTLELAALIAAACPRAKKPSKHPATRSFQAIRMAVNRELEELQAGLEQAVAVLRPGGRLGVISFHSLEDRMVKRFMRVRHTGPQLPRGLPPPPGAPPPPLASVLKPVRVSTAEVVLNPRARSATLRVAELRQ